ncbi:MAG: outer membrane protein transport protein, partial [Desulfuromonadales bacterium]|nr:outer membrane protein transport protein [Desulfuromonadales bacterium]
TDENWKDNMRYSIGGTYHHSDTLAFRAGVAYDETPIPEETRTPRIPGADRTWVSLGASYVMNNMTCDFAYAHLFVDDGAINLTDMAAKRGALVGSFANNVDIVSIEASYRF